MNELALFAGAGGGILGGHLLGWRTVCAVEWEPYPASVLLARQNDGILPPFPVWDDIQTFDGRPWRGIVDVISGGFPCQDISAAGKGAGIDGERSGMWREMARIIHEVRPRFVFVENSPMLTSRGLGTVLGDLAEMGFDAKWGVLGAADVGAPHQRDRIWIVANSKRTRLEGREDGWEQEVPRVGSSCPLADTNGFTRSVSGDDSANAEIGRSGGAHHRGSRTDDWGQFDAAQIATVADPTDKGNVRRVRELGATQEKDEHRRSQANGNGKWWETEPNVGRVADGVAARVDRLKAIGNGQVPEVARRAWGAL
jgi:DNA (cytosine-5)-methyltransferase 1